MRKIFLALVFLINTSSFSAYTVENTGCYTAYVKSMPFWHFWNYYKIINILAEESGFEDGHLQNFIKDGLPVLFIKDFDKAQSIKVELEKLGCDLEFRRVVFTFDKEEDANQQRLMLEKRNVGSMEGNIEKIDVIPVKPLRV